MNEYLRKDVEKSNSKSSSPNQFSQCQTTASKASQAMEFWMSSTSFNMIDQFHQFHKKEQIINSSNDTYSTTFIKTNAHIVNLANFEFGFDQNALNNSDQQEKIRMRKQIFGWTQKKLNLDIYDVNACIDQFRDSFDRM